jgi:hypothetical protein
VRRFGDEMPDKGRADKTGAAGDEDVLDHDLQRRPDDRP